MFKNFIVRVVNSYLYAMGITGTVYAILLGITGKPPLMPEYSSQYSSEAEALLVQLLLIGCMSAALGGFTVIMEIERLSLLVQTGIYYFASLVVWLWIGNKCWCIFKYPQALLSTLLSYTVSYIICWTVIHRNCKKNIQEINQRILEMKGEDNE